MAFTHFDTAQVSRRQMLRAGGLAALSGGVSLAPFASPAFARSAAEARWPTVASAIDTYVGGGKVANMVAVLGFGQRDPEVLAQGALGFGSSVDAGLDSLYRLYSQTKPVTGMATMICIEEGLLGLDQPLAEIIPAFASMTVLPDSKSPLDRAVPATRPITIRHLLTHTAGLGYEIMTAGPLRDAFRARGISSGQLSKLPIPGFPAVRSAPTLEAFADRLASLPLIAQPGTRWAYSASIDLLGRVIEVVSKTPFDRFLRERFFEPLGMTSTFFQVPARERARLTDNYAILNGIPLPVDPAAASIFLEEPPLIWGGSGLVGSPRDYDRFQRMLVGGGMFEGKRIMAEAAVRTGTSDLLPPEVTLANTWMSGGGFGAGGAVRSGAFGWGGAAGTNAFVQLSSGLRGALYTQYMPAETLPIQNKFPEWVLKDLTAMQNDG